jgi:hypothetical protein
MGGQEWWDFILSLGVLEDWEKRSGYLTWFEGLQRNLWLRSRGGLRWGVFS